MLFTETTAVYCDNYTKTYNAMCGTFSEIFNVTAGGNSVTLPFN